VIEWSLSQEAVDNYDKADRELREKGLK
jgi:hypothetical protein